MTLYFSEDRFTELDNFDRIIKNDRIIFRAYGYPIEVEPVDNESYDQDKIIAAVTDEINSIKPRLEYFSHISKGKTLGFLHYDRSESAWRVYDYTFFLNRSDKPFAKLMRLKESGHIEEHPAFKNILGVIEIGDHNVPCIRRATLEDAINDAITIYESLDLFEKIDV